MSGGGKGSTTNTTVNYSPEEAARRAQLMDAAMQQYAAAPNLTGQYPGAAPVGFSADTLAAQELMRQSAAQNQQIAGQMTGAVDFGLNTALNVDANPYFQQALSAATRPITQSFRQEVLPGISSAAIQQGAYGGARQGISEALASDRYLQNLGDTTAKMSSDAYGQGLDTFARTLALAPSAMQATQLPSQQLSAVGAQNENLAQDYENFAANQRLWDINAPWIPLQNAAQIVYGGGSSQSTSTAQQQQARNPLLGVVGGGVAGYAAGASMGASLGPWGAAAGAVLGALL